MLFDLLGIAQGCQHIFHEVKKLHLISMLLVFISYIVNDVKIKHTSEQSINLHPKAKLALS